MNRYFFLLLAVFSFAIVAKADYLNTKSTNQCIHNVMPYQGNKGLCYTKTSNNNNFCSTTLRYKHLIAGYELVGADCLLKNDLNLTGLSEADWNYFLAVLAHVMGFTMLFLVNYISVLVVKVR